MKRLLLAGVLAFSPLVWALDQAGNQRLSEVQQRWAQIQYQLPEAQRAKAFEALAVEAAGFVRQYPGSAEPLIWEGIVNSSWAGATGGLGALGKVKAARASLEKALALDPKALQGSAYTSLGALYDRVPGWPLGFGDQDKAEAMLRQALAINPDGIDSNYFWADHLYRQNRYGEARAALDKALHAAPRPGRALADQGRRGEIDALLKAIEDKQD
ncbi:tetratricopeptide repeat protein [Pseudomonas soli]|jgi:tetratricopeptide (TPR) repeat protein|uniref:Tetratricopeptide repeat protein n=1 Tax=Pseudomonas soli TaxID=1306993 RepID=A0AAJ5SUZ4_9PSED|nr:tetratricopeptide repeat protein [Pseudomonas soli]AIN58917.1 tetratricopeptide repeat protein [Pseudomonas soli]PYC39047.1 tetratricopeptide repeat protein [Pseudomonas soli]UXZ47333.1 tetratricopeptide repeat protein [Pseudomonas soli]